jgi:hypothetical protein
MCVVSDAQDHLVRQGFTRAEAEYLTRPAEQRKITRHCVVCDVEFAYAVHGGTQRACCSRKCTAVRSRRSGTARVVRGSQRRRLPIE